MACMAGCWHLSIYLYVQIDGCLTHASRTYPPDCSHKALSKTTSPTTVSSTTVQLACEVVVIAESRRRPSPASRQQTHTRTTNYVQAKQTKGGLMMRSMYASAWGRRLHMHGWSPGLFFLSFSLCTSNKENVSLLMFRSNIEPTCDCNN
jgi:hypothetical protein